jgi:hypothetical protein
LKAEKKIYLFCLCLKDLHFLYPIILLHLHTQISSLQFLHSLMIRCDLLEDGDDADEAHVSSAGGKDAHVSVVGGEMVRSRSNAKEARLVVAHVRRLLTAGLRPQDIAVITPYNGQVREKERAWWRGA